MGTVRPDDAHDDVSSPAAASGVGPLGWPERIDPNSVVGLDDGAMLEEISQPSLSETEPSDQHETLSDEDVRLALDQLAKELSGSDPPLLSPAEPDVGVVIAASFEDESGYGPIDALMHDHAISEILINGPHQVFVEKRGQLQATDVTFRDEEHLLYIIRRMVAETGRRLDRTSPMVDARLRDGSRLNAVLNPPALNGPLVSIRRFGTRPLTVEDLLANDSMANEMLDFLAACVKARINVIVSGGTGSGKTTLLNALSRFIPRSERVVTIEDTAELELQQPHLAKLEAQPAGLDGQGAVSMGDLVKNALRMRPDRIIVGECRGAEALDMLQAMNTGHEGSLTTVHANTTREALSRIELMIGLAGIDIPIWAVRKLIVSSINVVVQVSRLQGGNRKLVAISEITGMEGDMVSMHDLFAFVQTGIDSQDNAVGYFRATGIRPHFLNKLTSRGANVSSELFIERQLQSSGRRGIE